MPEALNEVANEYQGWQRHEQARQLYQYIVDTWPESDRTLPARTGVVISNIALGGDPNAQAALDSLIADFNDHLSLPQAVFVIGEQYYNEAFRCEKEGLDTEARDYFRKAIAVWERIITELPLSPVTPEACYFAARCYERIGEYDSAIQLYEIVLHDWPDYQFAGIAQYLLARCYEKLVRAGQITEDDAAPFICQACENVLSDYPDSPVVRAAVDLLERWQDANSQ